MKARFDRIVISEPVSELHIGHCYPMTPVDCFISEVRDLFSEFYGYVPAWFEERVAQFEEEVAA